MIQVRSQYNNLYMKILDKFETFDYTLEKIRSIPGRVFNMQTGEWMIPREHVGFLLSVFGNQISWMTPLKEIVQDINIDNSIVKQYLNWESESEFKNFKLSLYPYQKVGANFLIDRECAAVFDGCGLGKTPQLIGACMKLFEQKKAKTALIVTLNSLKRQWAREIEKFTGESAIPVTGSNSKREKLIKGFKTHKKVRFLVINYELLRTEKFLKMIKALNFDIVALDEAQKIKTGVTDKFLNLKPSQTAAAVYQLKKAPYRFIATATPLQSKAEEVWSLFNFMDDNVLGSWEYFRERYCKYSQRYGITGYENIGELYYRIAPYFIRRTKEFPEIQQQLPKVQHSHVFLDMTDTQERIHDYLLDKLEEIKESARNIKGYTFINGQSLSPEEAKEYYDQLAQGYQIFLLGVCDSPQLLTLSESPMVARLLQELTIDHKDLLKSPKVDKIVEFYKQMIYDEPKSKIVIFTRFERMLQVLKSQIPNSVVYHGGMNDNEKDYAVECFRNDPNCKVFISTDAGSTGLNLQVANYMIHCDLPWDPTLIEQRNGRIDRTGNEFSNVTIYYYVMSNSYDENLLEILERKSNLASTIIDGGAQNSRSQNVNTLAVDRLLKNRAKKKVSLIAQ